jgi:acyl carrier protein
MENLAIERDATIRNLTRLWAKLLGKEVGINDDFFDAGGSSLAGINMIIEVQSTYHVELDVEAFFEEPTIARLASAVAQAEAASKTTAAAAAPHPAS